ncbi:MAG: S8 family peptidase, partial [Actinomycetota bacterium]
PTAVRAEPAPPAREAQTMIVVQAEPTASDLAGAISATAGVEVVDSLEEIGVVVVSADPVSARRLDALAGVEAVVPNQPVTTSLATSAPRIGADLAWSQGHRGVGTRVAVVDTGVAAGHPALSGAIVEEACFAPAGATCPNGLSSQQGAGAARPGSCTQCAHGTHVTGIVAARGGAGVGTGVAPGTEVLAVNIFDRPDTGAPAADLASLLAALDHVAAEALQSPITAVNLSIVMAGGSWPGPCDGEPALAPLRAAVDLLAERGVVTVVAAGNGGGTGPLHAPGCLSRALTVSSASHGTNPAISSFADVGPLVDLLAPGESIVSTLPGAAGTMSGTSMAAPHVSGALALLHTWRPDVSPHRLVQLLVDASPHVSGRGSTFPFTDLRPVLTRAAGDSVLLRRGARMLVRNVTTTGAPNRSFIYGRSGDVVLVGDWDGDGIDTPAVRRGAVYHLTNSNASGAADVTFVYGRADDVVLVGDWDGDGRDSLAVRRGRTYHLRNQLSSGVAEVVVTYGRTTDDVVVGDWDGDQRDTLGIRRATTFHLRDDFAGGPATTTFIFGRPTDEVLVGDWDGDDDDTVAVRRAADVHLLNDLVSGPADWSFTYGSPTDVAFAANSDGL